MPRKKSKPLCGAIVDSAMAERGIRLSKYLETAESVTLRYGKGGRTATVECGDNDEIVAAVSCGPGTTVVYDALATTDGIQELVDRVSEYLNEPHLCKTLRGRSKRMKP